MGQGTNRIAVVGMILAGVAVALVVGIMVLSGSDPARSGRDKAPSIAQEVETRQVGDYHWIVSRPDKEQYLGDLAGVNKEILMKPNPGEQKDSVTHLTIIRLSGDSPIYTAGFRKGDRILKVNGTPIETMGRAINLIHEVKRTDDLTVQVQRGEEILDYRFEFR